MCSTEKLHAMGGLTAAVIALAAFTSPAAADLSNIVFSLEAAAGSAHGAWTVNEDQGQWTEDMNGYQWTLGDPIQIRDPQSGAVLATLGGAGVSYLFDPQVNLSFSVIAGAVDTNFTFRSAMLSFPTIQYPMGRASAVFTVTDADDEGGALLTGLGGMAYLGAYNGFVPGGTQFTQLIQQVMAPPGESAFASEAFPGGGSFATLGAPVSDMSSQISFTLSANDLASGTSNFEIIPVPEPCGLLLLAACAGVIRRR
jgi:hypothetical protein